MINYSYYGVNLGKAEIDTEDENGKKGKKDSPYKLYNHWDRRVYKVLGDKCQNISVNFKNITSLDGIFSISPNAFKSFYEGGLDIVQVENFDLTSLPSLTQPLHTLEDGDKKTEIGSQVSQRSQIEKSKQGLLYIYNNQDTHTHTPDFFLSTSVLVQMEVTMVKEVNLV